jgi:FKBP-type peptidyl-prolyl cis-trans isomerase
MRKNLFITTFILCLFISNTYAQKPILAKTTKQGLEFTIYPNTKNADPAKPKQGDIVTFSVEVRNFKDSILQKNQNVDAYKLQKYAKTSNPNGKNDSIQDKFFEVFASLGKGDSAVVKEPTNNLLKEQEEFVNKKINEMQAQMATITNDKTIPDSSRTQYITYLQDNIKKMNLEKSKPNPLLPKDKHIFYFFKMKNFADEISFNKENERKKNELDKTKKELQMVQIKKEELEITQYLTKNNLLKKAKKTPSGLYYIITQEGKGEQATAGKKVSVNYKGELLSGKVFDTSIEAEAKKANLNQGGRTYEPIQFDLGASMVIKGWDEGIALLKKGGKAILIIPSPLAYGERGAGGDIPANSILRFEVELVEIK